MPTERIEIYPGVTIDVNKRHKKRAGASLFSKLSSLSMSESERRTVFRGMAREDNPNTKYSLLLLDEAVHLSKKVGEKKACKITGVKYWSLKGRKRTLIREGKYISAMPNPGHPRYTMAQKQACVRLASQLMEDKTMIERPHTVVRLRNLGATIKQRKWSHQKAFIEAGKRLGMNGNSVAYMWSQGMIPMN